ncbi:hypothetical protein [Flavobacterium sp. 1]|uniref:hypothetical protein n=1 Tax=Flavobacterium sp. 1 TaxID=2035200 RepID=UPI000C23458A|nr:hypothetical protein [Flavobacterium sp. 1]
MNLIKFGTPREYCNTTILPLNFNSFKALNLKNFGFYPNKKYKFWATQFSTYTNQNYSYAKAAKKALLSNRSYSAAPGYDVPDVTYVVEPIEGLWLLAIDGNVYIGTKRAKQYKVLTELFFENHKENSSIDRPLQNQMRLFLIIFDKFSHGTPANHFQIDLNSGAIQNLEK